MLRFLKFRLMMVVVESNIILDRVALCRHPLNVDPSIQQTINRAWKAPPMRAV